MRYSKNSNPALACLLCSMFVLLVSLTSCSEDDVKPTIITHQPYFHITLLGNDGQNLFTVDPELPSIINDEFHLYINEEEVEIKRYWVRPIDDNDYVFDENDRLFDPTKFDPYNALTNYYTYRRVHSQFIKLRGMSEKEYYLDDGRFLCNAVFFAVAVHFAKYTTREKKDVVVDFRFDWPRANYSWNFQYKWYANGVRPPELYLDGKKVENYDKDNYTVYITIPDESLYKDQRYSDPYWEELKNSK